MKYSFILTLTLFCSVLVNAQVANPFPKTIQVNGSAEMEIIPDQVYVHVLLKEYEKKGHGKVNIEKIKEHFLNQYKATGMHDSLISIVSYDGNQGDWMWRKKKRKDEMYASVTYRIKFSNSRQMDDLVNRLDDDATQNFQVVSTSHSKLQQFRRELKIEAVKAAKEKAIYLSRAVGENVGEAVTIDEPHEFYQPYSGVSNKMRDAAMTVESAEALPEVDFMKIRLKYDVRAVFSLK